jgi:RNA polymerase-binding transcription factor DksA
MNVQDYRRRLLELETRLSERAARAHEKARAEAPVPEGDSGDVSVAEESHSEEFAAAELDDIVLQQVKDALQRIDAGTFGQCVVDGAPIAEKRLAAIPWTPYCLKHQTLLEGTSRLRPVVDTFV